LIYQRGAAFLGAAAGGQNAFAIARRLSFGLEHLHGVLSGVTARRLCVCSFAIATFFVEKAGDSSCTVAPGGGTRAAVCPFEPRTRVRAHTKQPDHMGLDHAAGHRWTTVSSSFSYRAALATLVFTF